MKIGKWSIIIPDKRIVKQYGDGATWGYVVEDDSFWNDNLESNIRAIQYSGDNLDTDQVEHNDGTNNTVFNGDIKKFSDKWDEQHLIRLQAEWDIDNIKDETPEEKITRLGVRPTSYQSQDIY